ncbi:hypothetical protein B566_EDAN017633, partial [Ephemera danica]
MNVQSASKPEMAEVALQDMQCASDMLRQQLKQCRRRLTGPLPTEHAENLVAAQESAAKLMHAMHDCMKTCMQQVTSAGDAESGILPSKVLKLLQTAVTQHVSSESVVEMVQDMRNLLAVVETSVVCPIMLRAQCFKNELEEPKLLKQELEIREADIKKLKKVLNAKQEELGVMVTRKDLAESKLGNVHKGFAVNMEKLQFVQDMQLENKKLKKLETKKADTGPAKSKASINSVSPELINLIDLSSSSFTNITVSDTSLAPVDETDDGDEVAAPNDKTGDVAPDSDEATIPADEENDVVPDGDEAAAPSDKTGEVAREADEAAILADVEDDVIPDGDEAADEADDNVGEASATTGDTRRLSPALAAPHGVESPQLCVSPEVKAS